MFVPVMVTVPVFPANVANPGVIVDIVMMVLSLEVNVVELVASTPPNVASS